MKKSCIRSAVLAILYGLALSGCATLPAQTATDCDKTRRATVESREFVPENASYQDVRTKALNAALVDAVKQTLGARVARMFTMQTSTRNNEIDERTRDLSSERARGYVKSYKVLSERIEGQGRATIMVISIDAEVCVPPTQEDKDVVVIGDFTLLNGRKLDYARSIIAGKASQANSLVLGAGSAADIPHDIVVTGRLIRFDARTVDVVDGAAVFGALVSGLGERTGRVGRGASNWQAVAKIAGAASQMQLMKRVTQVDVVVAVEAVKRADNELVSQIAEGSVEIPPGQNPASVFGSLVRDAVATAASKLFAKLDGGR